MAHKIRKLISADLFEIKTVKPYPNDYDEKTKVAQEEQNLSVRPKIIEPLPNISKYGIIIVGYPNWWGTKVSLRNGVWVLGGRKKIFCWVSRQS